MALHGTHACHHICCPRMTAAELARQWRFASSALAHQVAAASGKCTRPEHFSDSQGHRVDSVRQPDIEFFQGLPHVLQTEVHEGFVAFVAKLVSQGFPEVLEVDLPLQFILRSLCHGCCSADGCASCVMLCTRMC